MAIIAKAEQESNFTPIPEGVHTAICYGIIDIGVQYSEKFDKSAQKAIIMWEFPDETYEHEGQQIPRVLSKDYTLSLAEKSNLRKDLQAWRGKTFTEEELVGFDLKNILGKGCQIQLIHKENNAAIMGLPKGMKIPDPVNQLIYFDLSEPGALNQISAFPEWIQNKIKESETYKELMSVNDNADGEYVEDDAELPL